MYFKVTQDRPGRDLLLGQGFVDGTVGTRPGDLGQLRFRLVWRYPDEPILAHLGIQATGPGGTTDRTLSIIHAEV